MASRKLAFALVIRWSRSASYYKQVGASADQAGFGLHAPDGGEQLRAPPRVFEPSIKIGCGPGRSLDTDERFDRESGLLHFASQLFGEVEVGSGEPFRPLGGVTVLPLSDVALDDRLKLRVQ